jgi:hypothetical protein
LFKDCYLLESVELPEYTTFIINYDAFKNCSSLKKIEIPSSVTQIYDRAFFQCGIETIMIPRSVKAFGSRCFYSCLNLSAVYLEKEYDSYGNRKELIVDSIPESMFEGCSNLRKIDGAISTKEIEEKAFKDTDLSEQETSIHTRRYGDFAFYGTNLKEIALDAEYIGAHAFENCNQLEKVRTGYGATASLKDLPFLGADAFKREGEPIDTLIIWSESMYYKFVDQGWTKYFKQVALQEWGNITVIIGDGWSAS